MPDIQITNIKYITLKKNWHRSLVIAAMSRHFPVTPQLVHGINYDEQNEDHSRYTNNGSFKGLAPERTKGVIGCWIAHSKAIEDITTTEGITVVLEDDFICKQSFFSEAQRIINNIDFEFDVLLFDPWGKGPLNIHKVQEQIYHPLYCGHPFYHGTHCIFVNNSSIQKILEAKSNSFIFDYDGFLLTSDKITTYAVYTGACTQRAIGSDVSPMYKRNLDIPFLLTMLMPSKVREKTHAYNRHFKPRNNINRQQTFSINQTAIGFYESASSSRKVTEITADNDKYILKAFWFGEDYPLYPVDKNYLLSKKFPLSLKLKTCPDDHVQAITLNDNDHWNKLNTRPPDRVKIDVPHEHLSKFQGKYAQRDTTAIIVATRDRLVVKMNYIDSQFDLFPCGELEFFCKEFPLTSVDFSATPNGLIESLMIFQTILLMKVPEFVV